MSTVTSDEGSVLAASERVAVGVTAELAGTTQGGDGVERGPDGGRPAGVDDQVCVDPCDHESVVEGATTCTRCPRRDKRTAWSRANRAAPLMSCGNVSAAMSTRSGVAVLVSGNVVLSRAALIESLVGCSIAGVDEFRHVVA